MEYLSEKVNSPQDPTSVIPWLKFEVATSNTMHRILVRTDLDSSDFATGISYELISKIAMTDVFDARNVGPCRTQDLIDELNNLFAELDLEHEEVDDDLYGLLTILETPEPILKALLVEDDWNLYLMRIGRHALLNKHQEKQLIDCIRKSNPEGLDRFMAPQSRNDAIANLVNANLRLAFAVAKRDLPESDLRAKTVAANLGVLVAIRSFKQGSREGLTPWIISVVHKFIENFVEDQDFDYQRIEKLITKHESMTHINLTQKEILPDFFKLINAKTLTELLQFIDEEFLSLPKVNDRKLTMFKHRSAVFGQEILTLDEIGKECGVTRERVRQITDFMSKVVFPVEPPITILEIAVSLLRSSEDEEDFQEGLDSEAAFVGVEMDSDRLYWICKILGQGDLENQILDRKKFWESNLGLDAEIKVAIRKYRSMIGLYDLEFIARKFAISIEKTKKLIMELYPRVIFVGSLALARTKNNDTMFENSIAKQLKVASSLKEKTLIDGIRRLASNRGFSLIGSDMDLSKLINLISGNPPTFEFIESRLIKKVEFVGIELWLIDTFRTSGYGFMHLNDLISKALIEQINPSSIGVYVLKNHLIRNHGSSIYSLVGSKVDSEEVSEFLVMKKATREPTQLDYSLTDTGLKLQVKPNINVIQSGIVFPPAELKKMLKGLHFDTQCSCGKLSTRQKVKFAPSGFWTGFTAMIRHGMSVHKMQKNSVFIFDFDFVGSCVTLKYLQKS